MKLRKLTIKNFRGIRELDWDLSGDVVCLIGPGDSTKSTILLALEYLFSPNWNLSVSDVDFYQMSADAPIEITAVVTELPENLISEDKFGLYLGFWNPQDGRLYERQNNDNYQKALQVKLEIDNKALEPKWTVISLQKDGRDPRQIATVDRRALGVARIGNYVESDLSWGRNSALSRLTEKEDISQIPTMLAEAERKIFKALSDMDFSALSEATFSGAIEEVRQNAQTVGIDTRTELHTGVNPMQVSLRQGAIALFDDNLPFSLRGAGSCRLMAMAIHKAAVKEGSIILIDEIENGLEPYRLRYLIRQLRPKDGEKHQVIFTTHSPIAIVECRADELYVAHSKDGNTEIDYVGQKFEDIDLQAVVRSVPEAFLSRKVIVCEGKTEAGFLMSLDRDYWQEKHRNDATRYKYQTMAEGGVVPIESSKSGGSESPKYAVALAKLGYRVVYFGDSDCNLNPSEDEMEKKGVEKIFLWDGGVEIERRLCFDLPWDGLKQLVAQAIGLQDSGELIWNKIYETLTKTGHKFTRSADLDSLRLEVGETDLRENLGKAADDGKWFKRIDKGEALGVVVAQYLDTMENTPTANTLLALEKWCYE